MPNTKSAAKAMRQSIKRHAGNLVKKDAYKKAVKEVRKLILAGKKTDAASALTKAFQAMDKAAKTHVIHKNTVSRLKSRLSKAIAKIK
ncbi:MAG: 30S ribosomal protein S20 [Patescibacteria group bacterium]